MTDQTPPPEFEGRCSQWMPVAKTWCARPPHAKGRHRTAESHANSSALSRARESEKLKRRYAWMDHYKTERGCIDCGYNANPKALDLDHLEPSLKVANVSRLIKFASWETVMAEVDKCAVRCANCHRVKTFSPPE